MRRTTTLLIAILCVVLVVVAAGCGLDGIRGELVRMTGNHYVLREPGGQELTLHIDSRTHKDAVQPGDDVQVYMTKDGYALFIQRLEKR
ncbi:MAG: hypothetical protein K0S45_1265 [Nitrospira sp.]|jgi:hypothetical protein|nr:hypothetical protein [Nitrospira sp.]